MYQKYFLLCDLPTDLVENVVNVNEKWQQLSKDDNAERRYYPAFHHFIPSHTHSFVWIYIPLKKNNRF